jgi:hypothetical protein
MRTAPPRNESEFARAARRLGLAAAQLFLDALSCRSEIGSWGRYSFPFKRFSIFTMDSMIAANAGISPNIIWDIACSLARDWQA